MQTWHEILGHCNCNDIQKLQDVVISIKMKGSTKVCTQGKFYQMLNIDPDLRTKKHLYSEYTQFWTDKFTQI